MANAPKHAYYLTEKQARTLIDAVAMQARFFNRHSKKTDITYLRKVQRAMELQHKKHQKSPYGKLTFGGHEIKGNFDMAINYGVLERQLASPIGVAEEHLRKGDMAIFNPETGCLRKARNPHEQEE